MPEEGAQRGMSILDTIKPGLSHRATLTVGDSLTVPGMSQAFASFTDMPPVFATPYLVAFVEWACLEALAPYLGPAERTVGTRVEITHTAATPVGMRVTADVELVAVEGRRLRFKVACRDELEPIGEGMHERTVIAIDRFGTRLDRKRRRTG
jgi:fluoroacetyl-CoA thioesterase